MVDGKMTEGEPAVTLIFTSICMPSILIWMAYNYSLYNMYFLSITTIGSVFSVFFWMDPVNNRNQMIHKFDSISAKFVILNYTIYKLFINRNNIWFFLWSYFHMLYYFYMSNKVSSKNWCSELHIRNHITAHLYCMFCCYIAFF